jgi:hypothetical protein
MYLQNGISIKLFFVGILKGSLTERAGSGAGAVSQMYGFEDPAPHPDQYQNVTDPEHCF